MEDNFNDIPEKSRTRPIFLTVLCILTFISTGCSTLIYLFIPPNADLLTAIVKASPDVDQETRDMTDTLFHAGWNYYLIIIVLTILSLIGTLLMWKLKRNGFHFYTIANILLFFVPIMWFGLSFSVAAAFFPTMFIFFYAMNLRFME